MNDTLKSLEKSLDYAFREPSLLRQAITRKSGSLETNTTLHNERLEFFGDSIVRTVIDDILMTIYPLEGEMFLSPQRDILVSKSGFLYESSVEINLLEYVIMGKGERKNCEGPGRKKILSSVMEAIIAAVFIDCGKDYGRIKIFISKRAGFSEILHALEKNDLELGLFHAVNRHDVSLVESLLGRKADPLKAHDLSYLLSCHCCIRSDHMPAWIETRNFCRSKSSPLDLAIRRLNGFTVDTVRIVKLLLKHGADPNPDTDFPFSLLHETIAYYPKRNDYNTESTFEEIFLLLRKYGADLEKRDFLCYCGSSLAFTPLEVAVILKDLKKVQILLEGGVNPNLRNKNLRTSLHIAALCLNRFLTDNFYLDNKNWKDEKRIGFSILSLLLQFRGDLDLEDKYDKRPLGYLDSKYHSELYNVILDRK